MSDVTAVIMADYRSKSVRKFIERMYQTCESKGYGMEWIGYRHGGNVTPYFFYTNSGTVYFDPDAYDKLFDKLGVADVGQFKILMIKKGEKQDDCKVRIIHCLCDAKLAEIMIRASLRAASKNKVFGNFPMRTDRWDIYDLYWPIDGLGDLISIIIELISGF